MTYLARPRIGFFSTDAVTNPSTANNENVIHLLDYDNITLLNPPELTGGTLPTMTPAAYRQWMTTLIAYADPLDQVPDPSQPDWQQGMPGYWNYWGDHLSTFGDAKVTSLWLRDDPVTPGHDPLFGASVTFSSRIVDVNPADTFCSRFVAAGFSVVGADRSGEPTELVFGVPTTSMTRWLNFFRPGGAGTFQAVIPNDRLSFVDESRFPDSAALRALQEGAAAGGGLLLRWCYYGMATASTMMQMYDRFQQGESATNPKVGRVVGSLGVWNGEDMVSTPVGRMLQQPGPPFFPATRGVAARPNLQVKSHEDVERVAAPTTALGARSAASPCAHKMGTAAAVVQGDRVVLDLNTAFPEIACDPNATGDKWAKHSFGEVSLVLVYDPGSGEQTAVLGPVSYDRLTYEQLGGVWEVAFDPDSEAGRHVASGSLRLVAADGTVLLQEIDVPVVLTDDQAVYLDLGKSGGELEARGRAALRVFSKGEPIDHPVQLRVERWNDVQKPGKVNSVDPLVITATEITEESSGSFTVEVPAGGRVDVPIEADQPRCYKLRYLPPGMQADPENPAWAVEWFSTFRVLPFDDYSEVPDADVTFDYVYREVLNYFAILFPVMSTIIPWGPDNTPRDPERVAQFAALIRQAIDESRIGTALEMPITRDLSAGKRALLRRWCDLQLQGGT